MIVLSPAAVVDDCALCGRSTGVREVREILLYALERGALLQMIIDEIEQQRGEERGFVIAQFIFLKNDAHVWAH